MDSESSSFMLLFNAKAPNLQLLTSIGSKVNIMPINVSFIASDTNLTQIDIYLYDEFDNLISFQSLLDYI